MQGGKKGPSLKSASVLLTDMPSVHELLSQLMSPHLQEGYICCLATAKALSMLAAVQI